MTVMLHAERWFTTSDSGTGVIKHKSAEPGVGCSAFGSNSLSVLMQVNFLRTKRQCFSTATKCNDVHAQDSRIERRGGFDVFDGEYQVVKAVNFHGRRLVCLTFKVTGRARAGNREVKPHFARSVDRRVRHGSGK